VSSHDRRVTSAAISGFVIASSSVKETSGQGKELTARAVPRSVDERRCAA